VPEASLDATIRALERLGATCLAAPLLQRLRADGSIDTPAVIADPFREFPSCSVSLYRLMGSAAMLSKFPLLRCGPATVIQPGNHWPANGPGSASSPLLGASHHFKWKRTVLERIRQAVETRQTAWEDYAAYLVFLQRNGFRLPLGDAFVYSRRELFRRGLLRRMAWHTPATHRLRRMARRLPGPLGRGARAVQRALRSRRSA
jgi:hypothetical protein